MNRAKKASQTPNSMTPLSPGGRVYPGEASESANLHVRPRDGVADQLARPFRPVEAFDLHPLARLEILVVLEEMHDPVDEDVRQILVVVDLLVIARQIRMRHGED